jgi:hypothetical protein
MKFIGEIFVVDCGNLVHKTNISANIRVMKKETS